MTESQAIGRVHRIGQTRQVFVTRYFVRRSIETVSYAAISLPNPELDLVKASGSVCAVGTERQIASHITVFGLRATLTIGCRPAEVAGKFGPPETNLGQPAELTRAGITKKLEDCFQAGQF